MPSNSSNLFTSDVAMALKTMADDYAQAYPDLHSEARRVASELLMAQTGLALDPDKVYWHRFDQANSSALTFTGWQHYGTPVETLTLTELVIQRFTVENQINRFDLNLNSGFYSASAEHGRFDEGNEVKMLPETVMDRLWEKDFNVIYRQRLAAFYERYATNARILAKSLFFSTLYKAYSKSKISLETLKDLVYLACGPLMLPPGMDVLRNEVSPPLPDKVFTLGMGKYTAKGILGFYTRAGYVLYLSSGRLLPFESARDLYEWVRTQAARPDLRRRLLKHFSLKENQDTLVEQSLNQSLDSIRDNPWRASQSRLRTHRVGTQEDVFTLQQRQLREQSIADSETLLSSNRELRLRIFNIELATFLRLSAGLAPGDALIAAATLGAGLLGLGLSAERIVDGDTTEERKTAMRRAIAETIAIIFTLPALRGADEQLLHNLDHLDIVEPQAYEMTITRPSTPSAMSRYEVQEPLLESQLGKGRYRGVYIREADHMFIRTDSATYRVRYLQPLDQWVIVDPAKPDTFFGSWPVERNALDEWVTHANPILLEDPIFQDDELLTDTESSFSEGTARVRDLARYQMPPNFQTVASELLGTQARPLIATAELEPIMAEVRLEVFRLRRLLAQDSAEYLRAPILAPRPSLPALTPELQPNGLLKLLYKHNMGVVLGEESGSIASKKLLTKSLAELKSLGVHTLYVDSFMSDLQQELLDTFLHARAFTQELERTLRRLDQGASTTGSWARLLSEARRQAIKVRAINCSAAAGIEGLPGATAAQGQNMVKYYGYKMIEAHQTVTPHGKWIALVNNTRAFEQAGVPGLAQLTGTAGIRIKDVLRDADSGIYLDTPETLRDLSGNRYSVQGDVRIELGTLERKRST